MSVWPKFQLNNANNGRVDSWITNSELNTPEWSFETTAPIYSTPAISHNGLVTFSTSDGNIYSLSSSGGLMWNYSYQLNETYFQPNPTSFCSSASESSATIDDSG